MNEVELKKFIESKIEASKSLNFSIDKISDREAIIKTPLKSHLNHKGTAFGGNLYSLCAVASYSLVLNLLKANNLYTDDIVIAEGNIKYFKPVTNDIVVTATFDSSHRTNEIISAVKTGKRIPILIKSVISSGGLDCAEFSGRFAMKV